MDYQTIQAEARSTSGKGAARRTRQAGRIPAVAYGGDGDSVALTVNPKDLRLLHKGALGWNTPFNLAVEGAEDLGLTMLKAVQKHPVSGELLHADFMRVDDNVTVRVKVPIALTGKSVGVEGGANLSQPLRAVTVVCTPSKIPQSIVIDITELDIGDKVLLSSLPTPDGVNLVIRQDATVVNVARGRAAEVVDLTEDGEAGDEAAEEAEE
jgi:large subunit ribosomal protein L25